MSSDAISEGYLLSRTLRWASESGKHGMPTPEVLEKLGWVRVAEHETYKGSWLMERKQ